MRERSHICVYYLYAQAYKTCVYACLCIRIRVLVKEIKKERQTERDREKERVGGYRREEGWEGGRNRRHPEL